MYKNGEAVIARILELVAKCPKELQELCFEQLLSGYVQQEVGTIRSHNDGPAGQGDQKSSLPPVPLETAIPTLVLPRFKTTAKRLSVGLETLEALFDFNLDPFGLHAVTLPGKNNAEKSRKAALLAATRSYLASGSWVADWAEVKVLCVDQNCYDSVNHASNMKKGIGSLFKKVDPSKSIELSADGIKEAEKLLKGLAEGSSK